MKQRHPAFRAEEGKMEMAGEAGVCLWPFSSDFAGFAVSALCSTGFYI